MKNAVQWHHIILEKKDAKQNHNNKTNKGRYIHLMVRNINKLVRQIKCIVFPIKYI